MIARGLALSLVAAFMPLVHGQVSNPPPGYLPPVIARVEIVFSMVSHHHHIGDRVHFYNTAGNPPGNSNYAVPMLVYEPLVTLYNPHSVSLNRARIRISDPPVGFRFRKNDHYLRDEWSQGGYHGLARFQISNEWNTMARKSFTMTLRDAAESSGLTLGPGVSRLFAPRVEPHWTWELENSGGYSSRSFFDWNSSNNFTNVDGRTSNAFGVESTPGWNAAAGFQTDFLSHSSQRPAATIYPFESGSSVGTAGFVTIKLTDTVTVEAAPVRTVTDAAAADFQVELLGGRISDPGRDTYQQLKFSLANLIIDGAPSGGGSSETISRTFLVGDLLQTASDGSPGGKKPFAVLSVVAKPEALASGALLKLDSFDATELYDFRFDSINDFSGRESILPLDPPAEVRVRKVAREHGSLAVDFMAPPLGQNWRIIGGTDLENLHEELSPELNPIVPGPPGTGLFRALIDATDRGPRYFVRMVAE